MSQEEPVESEEQPPSSREFNRRERAGREDAILKRWDWRGDARGFNVLLDEFYSGRPFDVIGAALSYGSTHEAIDEDVGLDWSEWPEWYANLFSGWEGDRLSVLVGVLLRIVALKEMPYDEYLRTWEWRAMAKDAKLAFGGRCALDASHPAEHAHHRTYERRGREFPRDLIPLCASCHSKFHNR